MMLMFSNFNIESRFCYQIVKNLQVAPFISLPGQFFNFSIENARIRFIQSQIYIFHTN